jgi:hypothetical protein
MAFFFADRRAFLFAEPLVSAVDRRAYFLSLRRKKVAKERATPTYAVGCADSSALLEGPGGSHELACGSNNASRHPPALLRCSTLQMGTRKGVTAETPEKKIDCCGRPEKTFNLYVGGCSAIGIPGPLRGAEQRRCWRKKGRGLSEGRSPEFRSPPPAPSSAGNPRSGRRPRVAFFFGYFLLGEARRKYARAKGAETSSGSIKKAGSSEQRTTCG